MLNGTKNWITNGSSADVYLVIAQTYPEKGHKGINALIVEKGMPGFEIGPKEQKMGIRGSDTHSLIFNDVIVPKGNRIGEDGFGFKFAMKTLAGGRIGIAAQALGIHVDLTGTDLIAGPLRIEDRGIRVPDADVRVGPRIGVDYAGEDAALPYRFWVRRPDALLSR